MLGLECTIRDAAFVARVGDGLDVEELRKRNVWRKMYLARYARQCVLQWDDVPVRYMEELLEALVEIIKREHASSTEDH